MDNQFQFTWTFFLWSAIAIGVLSVAASGHSIAGTPGTESPFEQIQPPWESGRTSIYNFLSSLAKQQGGRFDSSVELPDNENALGKTGGVPFAAGTMDGIFGNFGGTVEVERVEKLYTALRRCIEKPESETVADLYESILSDPALVTIVDALAEKIRQSPPGNSKTVHDLAYWLTTQSPDRAAVKFGIFLLGILTVRHDEILATLGKHDEFTLYSMVAITGNRDAAETEEIIWQMSKRVRGWGRVHTIKRLLQTKRADIKQWFLREACVDTMMAEYLAYGCAVSGGLLEELRAERVDDALVLGATAILTGLFNGAPAPDIEDYEDGCEAVEYLLLHIGQRQTNELRLFLIADTIVQFVNASNANWESLEEMGWTGERRAAISALADEICRREGWRNSAVVIMEQTDASDFDLAADAGERMGLDVWPYRFKRQEAWQPDTPGNQWNYLMKTSDPERIDKILKLAASQFDLEAIATETARTSRSEIGNYRQHGFWSIVSGLARFPGKGWPFVSAALRSPGTAARNAAVQVLTVWDREHWPESALGELRRALAVEPVAETRAAIEKLISDGEDSPPTATPSG